MTNHKRRITLFLSATLFSMSSLVSQNTLFASIDLGPTISSPPGETIALYDPMMQVGSGTLNGEDYSYNTAAGSTILTFDASTIGSPVWGERKDFFLTVRHYDDATGGNLSLDYGTLSGSKTLNTPLTSSQAQWVSYTWRITDAKLNQLPLVDFAIRTDQPIFRVSKVWLSSGKSIEVDLGTTNVNRGLECLEGSGTDGANTKSPDGTYRVNDPASSTAICFYFKTSAPGQFTVNRRGELHVTIRYLDEGTGWLRLEYNSEDPSPPSGLPDYKNAGQFNKGGTSVWKTHTWQLTDAAFAAKQNLGADFRILYESGTGVPISIDRVLVHDGHQVKVDLGMSETSQGLACPQFTLDGQFGTATIKTLDCATLDPGSEFFYARVDDAYSWKGSREDCYLTIHYFDEGHDPIRVQYNAPNDNAYKETAWHLRTNSMKWKARTWHLVDAHFGNSQNAEADFRVQLVNGGSLDLIYLRDFETPERKRVMGHRFVDSSEGFTGEYLRELMTQQSQWTTTQDIAQCFESVVELYHPSAANHATLPETTQWLLDLRTKGIRFGLGVPAVKPWGNGQECFDQRLANYRQIQQSGGHLDFVSMDEPFRTVRECLPPNTSCTASGYPTPDAENPGIFDNWAVAETAKWISLMRAEFPDTRIGSVEPYPLLSRNDIEWWIESLSDACAAQGIEIIDYFSIDPNWGEFDPPVANGSWAEVKAISDWCRARNIPVSMLYWASKLDILGTPPNTHSQLWYVGIMEQGGECSMVGLVSEQANVSTWVRAPTWMVPENLTYSFTNSVLDFFTMFFP